MTDDYAVLQVQRTANDSYGNPRSLLMVTHLEMGDEGVYGVCCIAYYEIGYQDPQTAWAAARQRINVQENVVWLPAIWITKKQYHSPQRTDWRDGS